MTLALRFARISCVYESRFNFICHTAVRTCSTSSDKDAAKPPDKKTKVCLKPKLTTEGVRQNVQGYVFTRYIDMVKNYDKVLEKNFPSAVKVYRVFFDGVKEFYGEMKLYLKISRIVHNSPNGLKALNRKELELYMQLPRDMVKVAPALILSSLPVVGYAIFPLVFMYPRTFLTAHFWTLQQKAEFRQLKMKERLTCNRPVFRCLQAKLKTLKKQALHEELEEILGLIGSGTHPSVDALLQVKDIFATPPYNLLSLSSKHIKCLTKMHGLPGGLFKRHRLSEHAYVVHNMDLAIVREGGAHNMNPDAIKYACFLRGLNPTNLSNEEMIDWLRYWIKISSNIEEQHISLFLHLPLFLAYNHPNNWQMLYSGTKKSFKADYLTPKAVMATKTGSQQVHQNDTQKSNTKDEKETKQEAVKAPEDIVILNREDEKLHRQQQKL